ncbi:peroxiredoxin-like family protein [Psychroflexus aestuariivivens]|uniref:peroxiredoxin-like family protein n=1 Tax=Psychroflexus aestuariivivens TaxID=1795040 RepID=UPI000FDA4127|nr:peroxiredoxin-like family protein [Psychroflexus aestuariivivens]
MKKIFLVVSVILLIAACNENTPNQKKKDTKQELGIKKHGVSENSNPKGLKIGDNAPVITMKSSNSEEISLESLYRTQPLVVIFYRGYWCPVCNRHLSEFAERAVEIENAGAKIIAVTPETYENTEKTIDNTGIDFTVISDADGSVMTAFDVQFDVTDEYHSMIEEKLNASISETNANKQATLPVPATFIIDTNGRIVYKQFNPDYKQRASVNDILENLPK